MQPILTREIQRAWGVLGGAVALSAIALYVLWDGGAAQALRDQAEADYSRRTGAVDLQTLVADINDDARGMHEDLQRIKRLAGIRPVPPFLVPVNNDLRGSYFNPVYDAVKLELGLLAGDKRTAIGGVRLGFASLLDAPPPEADLQRWLTMLQLVTKAVYLTTRVGEDRFSSIEVQPLDIGRIVETGPAGRPALLREYPFSIRVRGPLMSVTWLLHQLSLDQRTDGSIDDEYQAWLSKLSRGVQASMHLQLPQDAGTEPVGPLILRGITINSEGTKDARELGSDELSELDCTLDLAGMEFLSDEQRRLKPPPPVARPASTPASPHAAPAPLPPGKLRPRA